MFCVSRFPYRESRVLRFEAVARVLSPVSRVLCLIFGVQCLEIFISGVRGPSFRL